MRLVSNKLFMKSTGKDKSRVEYQKHRFRLKNVWASEKSFDRIKRERFYPFIIPDTIVVLVWVKLIKVTIEVNVW